MIFKACCLGVVLALSASVVMAADKAAKVDKKPIVLPATAPMLEVWDNLIEPVEKGGSSAARLVLHNPVSETVVITGASSVLARQVMLQHYLVRDGVTQIYQLPRVEVPGGHEVAFVPYGLELRLMDVTNDITYGMDVPLTLRFANGTERTIRLTIDKPRDDNRYDTEDPNPDFQ